MKKILVIILMVCGINSFGQARKLSGYEPTTGRPGYIINDTIRSLLVAGTYVISLNDSTITFDSSKVITSVTKCATRDSFQFRNGLGTILMTLKDSVGGSSGGGIADSVYFWKKTGGNTGGAYPDTTIFIGTNTVTPLRFKTNNKEAMSIDSSGNVKITGGGAWGNIGNNYSPADPTAGLQKNYLHLFQNPAGNSAWKIGINVATNMCFQNNGAQGWDFYQGITKAHASINTAGDYMMTSGWYGFDPNGQTLADPTSTNQAYTYSLYNNTSNPSKIGIAAVRAGKYDMYFQALNGGFRWYSQTTELASISQAGNFLINTTTDVASSKLTLSSTTQGFLPPRQTSTQKNAISSPAMGLMVYDSTMKQPAYYNGGSWVSPVGTVFTNSATATVTNTTTETTIIGSGVGSLTIPANYLSAGKQIRILVGGIYSTPAVTAGSLLIKVKIGSTVIASGTASSLVASATNAAFSGNAKIVCATTGTSGTVYIDGALNYSVGNNLARFSLDLNNTGASSTINTTIANTLDITVTWDTASASKTVTATQVSVEALN